MQKNILTASYIVTKMLNLIVENTNKGLALLLEYYLKLMSH